MVSTSPEEAYRKYDDLTNKHIDTLRYRQQDHSHTHSIEHTDPLTRLTLPPSPPSFSVPFCDYRKLTKAIQDARIARDNEAIKTALKVHAHKTDH
jgi:hypothetical protein